MMTCCHREERQRPPLAARGSIPNCARDCFLVAPLHFSFVYGVMGGVRFNSAVLNSYVPPALDSLSPQGERAGVRGEADHSPRQAQCGKEPQ